MLKKLFKYDMRSVSPVLLILSACALGASFIGSFSIRYLLHRTPGNTILDTLLTMSLVIITAAAVFAVFAYLLAVLVLLLTRYYKNFFTDEGYLTFTLPAKTDSLLLSKIFCGVLWIVAAGAVFLLSLLVFVTIGMAQNELLNTEFFAQLGALLRKLGKAYRLWPVVLEYLVAFVVIIFYNVTAFYTALTLGSSAAKKHKILASAGIYYGMSVGIGAVTSVLTLLAGSIGDRFMSQAQGLDVLMYSLNISALLYIVLFTGITVGLYFINRAMLKNKLNLA